MTEEFILEKFKSIQESPDRVLFGYRYYRSKLEGFVGLSNLRLEVVQIKNGTVLHTLAAPVMEVRHCKCYVTFHDNNIVMITEGPRANILMKSCFVKPGETAAPAPNCRTVEVTFDSDLTHIKRVVDLCQITPYPGLDMRLPQFFRCTKHPERLRLNSTPQLLKAIGLKSGASLEEIKKAFLENIDSVSSATSEGCVVPFDWVYAGGMVIADASSLGKITPKVLYVRTNEFFNNWVEGHNWGIACV